MKKGINRRTFLGLAGGTLLGSGSLGVYASQVEPAWLDVTSHMLHLPRLDTAFHEYRIVQISDIHADNTWMDEERLMSVVALANQQSPDLIVITGDFVTRLNHKTRTTLTVLSRLRARDGVLAVLGNHDHWTDADVVRDVIRANGVLELNDSIHTIRREDAQLHVVGLDDLWPHNPAMPVWTHEQRFRDVLAPLPAQGAAILLVHEPDFADVAATNGRIDLQLSGHSHGGQVRVPLYGPLAVPPLGEKYTDGLYHIKNMLHYTSRGVGMVNLPFRFNCRPEIAVFTLL